MIKNKDVIYPQIDVADTIVGLFIDVLRRISVANRFVKAKFWHKNGDYPLGLKLGRERAGIVGMGSIGLNVAKKLNAFGCIFFTPQATKNKMLSSLSIPMCKNCSKMFVL